MEKHRKDKIRIMLVDDHPLVRYGITQIINAEPDMSVCCEAPDYQQALTKAGSLRPDFMIVDLSLKDINGIELIKKLKALFPGLPVLVLSMHDEAHYAERAIRAGARGYVMKQEGTETLVKAIRTVLSGLFFVSPAVKTRLLSKKAGIRTRVEADILHCLSDRELQVFELIGKGLKTGQIAESLNLSTKTVETYREHIKAKLKLKDGIDLLQHATLWFESIASM